MPCRALLALAATTAPTNTKIAVDKAGGRGKNIPPAGAVLVGEVATLRRVGDYETKVKQCDRGAKIAEEMNEELAQLRMATWSMKLLMHRWKMDPS